jgi:hypothetical protein
MTMRAEITRNVEQGVDDYGQPITQEDVIGTSIPCYAYFDTSNSDRTRSEDSMELLVNRAFIMWRPGQDIEKGDKVTVYDRIGTKLFERLVIESGPINRHRYLATIARRYGEN